MIKKSLISALLVLSMAVLTPAASLNANAAELLTVNNFDSVRYAEENPDLKAAFGHDHYALWNHYIAYGATERRLAYTRKNELGYLPAQAVSCETFNSRRYADDYADLKAAFGYDHAALWNHYLTFGRTENRKVYTLDGSEVTSDSAQLSLEQQFSQLLLSSLNKQRKAAGASALTIATDAEAAARLRGQDFVDFYNAGVNLTNTGHIRPDGSAFSSAYAVRPYDRYGENVIHAYFNSKDDLQSFAAQVSNALAADSDHYLNNVNKNFKSVGIWPAYIQTYGADIYYVIIIEYHP